ncbi:hypothetical protein CPB85DRAFT_1253923, partial [Mucidula mucida]
ETLDGWLQQVTEWETDFSKPCPYEPTVRSKLTLNEVKLQLQKEEQLELSKTPESVVPESSASAFISLALQIEELQRALAWEVQARSLGATYQELNIQKQRTVITRRIRKLRGLQHVYMPHLREYLATDQLKHLDAPADVIFPENVKLFLPSHLSRENQTLPRACKEGLPDVETRLREAECYDALDDLCRALRTRSAGLLFQVRNVSGQTSTTRAEGHQRRVLINVNLAKLRYRWSRNALFLLKGHGDWERQLKILEDKHVSGINERMLSAREEAEAANIREQGLIYVGATGPSSRDALTSQGEGRRKISWIWYSFPADVDARSQTSDAAFNKTLKIEWCKSRARMLRWREEVELLLEEMRCVVAFAQWKSAWWRQRVDSLPNASPHLQEGVSARALACSDRELSLAERLGSVWAGLMTLGQEILADVPAAHLTAVEVEIDATAEQGYDDEREDDDTLPNDEITSLCEMERNTAPSTAVAVSCRLMPTCTALESDYGGRDSRDGSENMEETSLMMSEVTEVP